MLIYHKGEIMDKVSYDKATYSLAIIDIDLFTECLQNLDVAVREAKENMELILTHNNEELVPFLQQYSLKKFEDVKKYFRVVRSRVDKYRNKLVIYFSKNLIAQKTFNSKVEILNELLKEKELFIDAQIEKCNNYIAANTSNKVSVQGE
jgi:hypothetical protein